MFINDQESQVFIRARRYIKKKEQREGKSRSRKRRRNRNRKKAWCDLERLKASHALANRGNG